MWVLAVDLLPWRGYEDLKNAGYVEDVPGQDRVRITAAGRAALAVP